ncbi:MAG: [citrate (pro-3S)-lyase] ligase [Clostridia bacterium]
MSYSTQEYGKLSGRRLNKLKDFLQKCDLSYDEGIEQTIIMENDMEIIATGSMQGNVIKCVAVHDNYRGEGLLSEIMTKLHYKMIEQGTSHYFIFTKPKNHQMFSDMGFYKITQTDDVLFMENQKDGISNYIDTLKLESLEAKGGKIGAIVANCNPFTNGHRYLIETASKACDSLHLFILSSENGMFSASERFEMVKKGVSDLENVYLHKTTEYLISPITFPTYFIKDKAKASDINCKLDLKIFYSYIVKNLGIDVRFVGQEPFCEVTRAYNQTMSTFFEEKGLEFVEIERKAIEDRPISATYIRQMISEGNFEAICDFAPQTTIEFIKQKYKA